MILPIRIKIAHVRAAADAVRKSCIPRYRAAIGRSLGCGAIGVIIARVIVIRVRWNLFWVIAAIPAIPFDSTVDRDRGRRLFIRGTIFYRLIEVDIDTGDNIRVSSIARPLIRCCSVTSAGLNLGEKSRVVRNAGRKVNNAPVSTSA
jgi:hypothetical protein